MLIELFRMRTLKIIYNYSAKRVSSMYKLSSWIPFCLVRSVMKLMNKLKMISSLHKLT